MRPSFVNHPKPFLCSVITEETPENSIYAIRTSEFDGAEAYLYDLKQLDRKYHNKEDLSRIFLSTDKPVIVYYYRKLGRPAVSDEERVTSFLTSVEAGASAVDMMADLFDPSPLEISRKPETVEKQKRLIDEIHKRGGEAMISNHTMVQMTTEQVLEHAETIQARGPDMLKIVPRVNNEQDLLEAFRTTVALKEKLTIPFIHIVMGPYNKIHRIVGPMLGSSCCFCVPYYNKDATLEQPLLRATREVFNNFVWRAVSKDLEGK
jgi:3-dehydroquinate dehydratase type I